MEDIATPLVTILTPCYNASKYISRLLCSVIEQDYPKIQMIVIDDGSTDDSAEIIKSYIPEFNKKGYSLQYYFQENSGQSTAINRGLKKVKGEFLLWPDSDDYYGDKDTISLLVKTLQTLPDDYAMARTWINYIDENSLAKTEVIGPGLEEAEFENCLYGRNFYFQPGCVIVDFKKLIEVTSLEIYTDKNAGQNWQLYLPILHKYKCKTIPQAKYNVLCRAQSHSRGQYKTFDEIDARITSYENTLLDTLDRIKTLDVSKRETYKNDICKKYAYERFLNAMVARKSDAAKKYRKTLKQYNIGLPQKELLKYNLLRFNLLGITIKLWGFFRSKFL